jgi:hypothetical protein
MLPIYESARTRGHARSLKRPPSRTSVRRTAPLGEVVVAAFDKAADLSTDPREVSRLATEAVALILQAQF